MSVTQLGSRKHKRGFSWAVMISAGMLALSACAHTPDQLGKTQLDDSDPLGGYNHAMYHVNYALDGLILKPVTQVYRAVMPEEGRTMVTNALENLYTPVVFANSVAQGDPQNSFATMWRFILNSTFGIGGLFDFASEAGLKNRQTDFGQTLALYGVDSGPYLVLPIVGPSNVRDGVGRLADALINPVNYADQGASYVMWGATAVDSRSNNMKLIDDIYESSLDPYSTFRSGYTQRRSSDIRKAQASREKALEKARVE